MNAHAAARDAWLSRALAALEAAPHVTSAELVGSLGRGDGDGWSDVDLLVFVDGDGDVRTVLDPVLPQLGEMPFFLDAPHNTRADGYSFGATFIVDGLPIGTDWYVWPARVAGGGSFDERNGEGPRGVMPPITDERLKAFEIAMTIVEAKGLARGRTDVTVDELRRRAMLAPVPALADAINRYLDVVETTT